MKLKLFALGCFAALMTGLWSCGPDDNEVSIEIVSSNEFPERSEEVQLTVRATSDNRDLTEVTIVVTTVDTLGNDVEVLNDKADASGLSFDNSFTITTPAGVAIGEMLNIVVTVKDDEGDAYDETSNIEAVAFFSVFRQNATFGHRYGSQAIGYNLVDAIQVYGDAPAVTKDMIDNSEQNKELSGVFISNGESGSQFVDLGVSYDLDELNTGVAAKRFAESGGSTLISVIANTKILVKLRDNTFAAVHLTAVDPDFSNQGATDNLGQYTIDIYKPKP